MIKKYNGHKYYVIFERSKLDTWYIKMLDPFFQHVSVARASNGKQYWLHTDCIGGNMLTNNYPMCDIKKLYPDAVIMECWSVIHKKPSYRCFHLNCVEMVKAIIGVRRWNVITPYQLYKHLKEKNNG